MRAHPAATKVWYQFTDSVGHGNLPSASSSGADVVWDLEIGFGGSLSEKWRARLGLLSMAQILSAESLATMKTGNNLCQIWAPKHGRDCFGKEPRLATMKTGNNLCQTWAPKYAAGCFGGEPSQNHRRTPRPPLESWNPDALSPHRALDSRGGAGGCKGERRGMDWGEGVSPKSHATI